MSRLASFKARLLEVLEGKTDVTGVNIGSDQEVLDKVHEVVHGRPPAQPPKVESPPPAEEVDVI